MWVAALYFLSVLGVVAGMIGLSHVLGERHSERATGEPYESGIVSTGSARIRFSAQFYLIAMLFVIFDMEAVFLFAWAVSVREAGWRGFAAALVFIAILMLALLYEWRMGTLDWGTRRGLSQSRTQEGRK